MKLSAFRLPRVAQRLVLPAVLLAGASAQADVNFTFTGMSQTSLAGFMVEQTYTFTFVVNGDFAVGASNYFDSRFNSWIIGDPGDDVLFEGFSGDGIGGSLASLPNASLSVFGFYSEKGFHFFDTLKLMMANPTGLTANGFPITKIELEQNDTVTPFGAFPATYVSPQDYFSPISGSPTLDGVLRITTSEGESTFAIDAYSVTLTSSTEVPFGVDSTVGLAALGLAGAWKLRRRRKQAAVNAAN